MTTKTKNEQKIAIKSNVKERLKKVREGFVYAGKQSVAKELVQNSFRAKANTIWATIEGDEFTIRDNGKGCKNPADLFTLDYSGFGVGYGEGFTSIYLLADWFKVKTQNWEAELDVKAVLDNPKTTDEDLMATLTYLDEIQEGFELTLKGPRVEEYAYELRSNIEEQCKNNPKINAYMNDVSIQKEDIFDSFMGGKYVTEFENRLYKGRFGITEDRFDYGIRVYYEYRLVETLYIDGAIGVILLKENAVNLRAPDRTAIINDEEYVYDKVTGNFIYDNKTDSYKMKGKLHRLKETLKKDVKTLLKPMVANGDYEEIEEFAQVIEYYLSVKEYVEYLTINPSDLDIRIQKERKTVEADSEEDNVTDYRPSVHSLDESMRIQEEQRQERIQNQLNGVEVSKEEALDEGQSKQGAAQNQLLSQIQKNIASSPYASSEKSSTVYSGSLERMGFDEIESENEVDVVRSQHDRTFRSAVQASDNEVVKKEDFGTITIKNIKKMKNVIWCSRDEKERYQDLITKYEYYNIHTFVSPHVLYDNALKHLNVPHITEMEDSIVKDFKLTKTGARNKKEERAMELLSVIEKLFNLPETFYISNIQSKLQVELNGKKLYQEKRNVKGYEHAGYIHLNRKDMYFGKLSGAALGKEKLGLHDLKFLVGNVDVVSHELAHCIYDTKDNTKEHLEKEEIIRKQITAFILENS